MSSHNAKLKCFYVRITPKHDTHNLPSALKLEAVLSTASIIYRNYAVPLATITVRFRAISQLELAAAVQRVLIRKLQGKENVIIRSARL